MAGSDSPTSKESFQVCNTVYDTQCKTVEDEKCEIRYEDKCEQKYEVGRLGNYLLIPSNILLNVAHFQKQSLGSQVRNEIT